MSQSGLYRFRTPLPVASGGTGATTLTDHGVLVGSGTGAVTALAVGTTGQLLVGSTGADPAFGVSANSDFSFTTATVNTTRTLTVSNTDNTVAATSAANMEILVGGGNVGDPKTTYTVTGGNSWATGIDNNASDSYKIAASNALGTTDTFIMSTSGERTMPLQPSFFAYNSATDNNVTGDGTIPTIEFNTKVFDQGSDYNNTTDTFTAPITGCYYFCAAIRFENIAAAHTTGQIRIDTSNRLYISGNIGSGARDTLNRLSITISVYADMDAGDTAVVKARWDNSTKTISISGGATVLTWFSGSLIC